MSSETPPYDLLGPSWDRDPSGDASTSYVILSTPRSGSTLLAEAMVGTGVLGLPAEYLELDLAAPYLVRRWKTRGFLEYRDQLLSRRSTSNGVFGVKVHWHQLVRLITALTDEPTTEMAVRVATRMFPGARLIRIRRRETVLQSISHWRALGTGRFASVQRSSRPDPDYDFDELHHVHGFIERSELGWDAFVQEHPADVLELTYEQIVDQLEATVQRCAAHVGVQDPIAVPEPRLAIQRNEWTSEIRSRYEQDLARRTG